MSPFPFYLKAKLSSNDNREVALFSIPEKQLPRRVSQILRHVQNSQHIVIKKVTINCWYSCPRTRHRPFYLHQRTPIIIPLIRKISTSKSSWDGPKQFSVFWYTRSRFGWSVFVSVFEAIIYVVIRWSDPATHTLLHVNRNVWLICDSG